MVVNATKSWNSGETYNSNACPEVHLAPTGSSPAPSWSSCQAICVIPCGLQLSAVSWTMSQSAWTRWKKLQERSHQTVLAQQGQQSSLICLMETAWLKTRVLAVCQVSHTLSKDRMGISQWSRKCRMPSPLLTSPASFSSRYGIGPPLISVHE